MNLTEIFYSDFSCLWGKKKKKKEYIPILKLFQNTEEEQTLPNSSYKARVTLLPKPDKGTTHKKKVTGQYL